MTIQASAPITVNGAMMDYSSTNIDYFQLVNNGMSVAGGVNFTTSAGASNTLTALGSAVAQYTVGSAMTLTLDSAYNIGLNLPLPLSVGQKFTFQVHAGGATTIATPTLSDNAVTLSGTTSVLAGAMRWYQGTVTQVTSTVDANLTAGTTFTSIAQIGSTNNYTVTLGTNTIVPTVGQLLHINVATGTLPSGHYPINKVTSATSFVVALPPSGTAWTATAATVDALSSGAPATYSPLMAIQGLYATATAIVTV